MFTALTLCVKFLLFFISSKSNYDDDGWIEGTNSQHYTIDGKNIAFHCACFASFLSPLYIIASCSRRVRRQTKCEKRSPTIFIVFFFLSFSQLPHTPPRRHYVHFFLTIELWRSVCYQDELVNNGKKETLHALNFFPYNLNFSAVSRENFKLYEKILAVKIKFSQWKFHSYLNSSWVGVRSGSWADFAKRNLSS